MVSPFSFTQVYNNFSLKGGTRGRQRKLVNLLRSNGFSTQTMLVCMSLCFRLIQLHFSNVSLEKRTNSNRRRRKRRSVKRPFIARMNNHSLLCSHIWLNYFPRSPQVPSSLFLQHNTALAPPYRVLIDTNFINFSLQNKLELISGMMDCLYAKCTSGLHMPCPSLHSPTTTD